MAGTRKLLCFSLCLLFIYSTDCMQCLSKDGSPVDWFIVYKLPKIKHQKYPLEDGQGFYYMDQNSPQLTLSQTVMNKTDHAIYYTLKQIYKNKGSFGYMMYNDQPPTTNPSLNHGHSKGTIGFDKSGGFWLVHSTPEFPAKRSDGYTWLKRMCTFGQTFLCISMKYSSMDILGHIFMYTYPKIYDHNLPESFAADNPVLAQVMGQKTQDHVKSPPWYNVSKIISKAGNKFYSFEKFTDFGKDLYDGLISSKLQENLLVETWRLHGPTGDALPSNCSTKYKVYNIDSMKFPDKGVAFKTTKDHSKWAISQNAGNWLCIGDINRQKTQFKRGGTQVCFQNNKAWNSFKNIVSAMETC